MRYVVNIKGASLNDIVYTVCEVGGYKKTPSIINELEHLCTSPSSNYLFFNCSKSRFINLSRDSRHPKYFCTDWSQDYTEIDVIKQKNKIGGELVE